MEIQLDRRTLEWNIVPGTYNQRVTGETAIDLTGPALGDPRLATSYDPSGTRVRGMLNNCGGGTTPWGTLLTAEENFNQYFAHRGAMLPGAIKDAHTRYGRTSGKSERGWELFDSRFDLLCRAERAVPLWLHRRDRSVRSDVDTMCGSF